MNDAYYSPHPRWVLPRPFVVAGPLGTGTRAIARMIAGRTGLPFVDVDRRIEHEAGASLAKLARDGGPMRIEAEARRVLERVALERPAPLVALGLAWPGPQAAHLFGRKMDLVCVRRSLRAIEKRRADLVAREPWAETFRVFAAFESNASGDPGEAELALLQNAGIHLDAGDQNVHEIADGLIESLERVAGAEAV